MSQTDPVEAVADFFRLVRGQPGYDRRPGGRVEGVELVVDVLYRKVGLLVFVA